MSDLSERLRVNAKSWRRKDAFLSREQGEEAELCDEAAHRIEALERVNEALRGAISWIDAPFVDANTTENELRQRVAFVVADAGRAALLDAKERKE